MQLNFRSEFENAPIRTVASALAIAGAVGGLAWAAAAPLISPLAQSSRAWIPPYPITAALGVACAVVALSAARRTWISALLVTAAMLLVCANLSARIVLAWGETVAATDTLLAGVFPLIAFAILIGEAASKRIKAGGTLSSDDEHALGVVVTFAVLLGSFLFFATFAASMPHVSALGLPGAAGGLDG